MRSCIVAAGQKAVNSNPVLTEKGIVCVKYRKEVYRSLTLILQFGINMLVPIFMCCFLGWFLDRRLNTSFIFVIMFFIGAVAGGRNVYIMAKHIFDRPAETHEDMK
ncbi:MAG TPA: F0F1-ATPase subunit [Lachnospiraceae bacterium]|nr:F0F1-ATPase subunit [Lachnospiraceae bacterium]